MLWEGERSSQFAHASAGVAVFDQDAGKENSRPERGNTENLWSWNDFICS